MDSKTFEDIVKIPSSNISDLSTVYTIISKDGKLYKVDLNTIKTYINNKINS